MVLALELLAALLVAVLLALFALGVRRRLVQRGGGTFDCSLRLHAQPVRSGDERAKRGVSRTDAENTEPEDTEADAAASASFTSDTDAERPDESEGKGWLFGVARYNGDRLEWFRIFSYAPRPRRVLTRGAIEVLHRRQPHGQEELALLPDAVVLSCAHSGEPLELAMSQDALTGFLAWLEAAPPGQHVNVA